MKQKLLFIAPDYYGFDKVVLDGLKKHSSYEIVFLNSNQKYKYRNFGERVYNFFSKLFLGINIKKVYQKEYIKRYVAGRYFDIVFINRPDMLSPSDLDYILERAKHSIALFWDSMEKIPTQEKYIDFFDECYSFDKDDCLKYNLKEITNFYFIEEKNNDNAFDVSYLATYDNRIEETISIFNYFQENGIKAKAKIFTYPSHPIKESLPKSIEVIDKIIPFGESYRYYLDSKIILDIAHPHQRGLSFRPFEAMGMNKKLITTNTDIVNYDFYNENNIFVIENPSDFSIPETFFKTDYQEIDTKIKEKYHIKNWVQKIFSDYEY